MISCCVRFRCRENEARAIIWLELGCQNASRYQSVLGPTRQRKVIFHVLITGKRRPSKHKRAEQRHKSRKTHSSCQLENGGRRNYQNYAAERHLSSISPP